MRFHVLTLFPEMIEQGCRTSILGRALQAGAISVTATNIRDYSENKHGHVDDYPYGGGAGMVMQPGQMCIRDRWKNRPGFSIFISKAIFGMMKIIGLKIGSVRLKIFPTFYIWKK